MKPSNWLAVRLYGWFELCLLKRAPQDDPLSPAALWFAGLAYLVTDLVIAAVGSGMRAATAMTAIDMVVLLAFTYMLLRISGRPGRLGQTLTALFGSGALLGLFALPLVQQAAKAQHNGEAVGGLALMWLLLVVWSVVVRAHIFRHALSLGFGAGALVAVLHAVLLFGLIDYLFPRVS